MSIGSVKLEHRRRQVDIQMAWKEYDGPRTKGGVGNLIDANDVFKPGIKVDHLIYGGGVVTAIRTREGIKTACIKFEQVGIKWILPDKNYMKVVE